MDRQTFLNLLDKYLNGTASVAEQGLLEEYYKRLDERSKLELSEGEEAALHQAILKNIQLRINGEEAEVIRLKPSRRWIWYAAATSLAAFLTVGGYFLLIRKPTQQIAQNQIHDIAPGGNKAVLTLANGTKISLTDAKIGAVANRGNVAVNKTADGDVAYNLLQSRTANTISEIKYDTLTIPRAGQFHLTLADGSKIWLNAATQIRYPENFVGKERKIELIYGEVDVDVKHNAAMPFKVLVKGQTIEDIGTNFNINAYDDEPSVKTTLLEGSAKISKGNQRVILKPGQQSAMQLGNNSIVVKEVDPESAVDWKNGEFDLKHESLETIMRKVSRWYDVKIVYQAGVKNQVTYSGSVSRYGNVSKVLESLETTGDTKFKIEGKQITVLR